MKTTNNKMVYIKFVILMIICTTIGGFIGYFGMKFIKYGAFSTEIDRTKVLSSLYAPNSVIMVLAVLAALVASVIILKKVNKKVDEVRSLDDDEYEKQIEKVQGFIGIPLIIENVMLYLSFFFLAIECSAIVTMVEKDIDFNFAFFVAAFVAFVVNLVSYMVISNQGVKALQRISPNIKGNVFDVKCHKDMLESLDEAQLQETALQAIHSTRVGSRVCYFLLLIAFLVAAMTGTGLFTVACLTIVLISLYVSGSIKPKK